MTTLMETGPIHPPVGLDIPAVEAVAPDTPPGDIVRGATPFVATTAVAVPLLRAVPGVAVWPPAAPL